MSTRIISTGACLPEKIVTNDDLSKIVETNDEWIQERTGIKSRRIISNETLTDLAYNAAKQALEKSSLTVDDIDLIIVSTITPEVCVPTTAANVRKLLGIKSAVAFDINAACTGFIYALTIADAMMKTNGFKNAIVIGSEALSRITDWTDRSTCILFGDGAGAAVVTNTPENNIFENYITATNDDNNALVCGIKYDENPFSNAYESVNKLKMNGQAVFKFAVNAMVSSIKTVTEKAGKTIDDIDWVVPHQANQRIIDLSAKKLKIDKDKMFVNLREHGNSSSASIPMALSELIETGKVKRGDLIALVGFGGGFTAGAILFEY